MRARHRSDATARPSATASCGRVVRRGAGLARRMVPAVHTAPAEAARLVAAGAGAGEGRGIEGRRAVTGSDRVPPW
ncbi:hypothetical protein KRM28CT15_63940 [Krasilnikovia sp. M28-CT-15]